jgi:hypothetical protein
LRKRPRLEDLKPRQLALGAAVLFLLSMAITLIVLLASPRRQAGLPVERPAAPASSPPATLGIQDFLLEAPEAPPALPGIVLFRERTPRWSEEQVRRYWVPVKQAILEILRRENDRRTEELLREVP